MHNFHPISRSPWLISTRGEPRPVRLYCFPYAGGSSAAYLPWHAALAPDIEIRAVQFPGRGARLAEPQPISFVDTVEQIGRSIAAEEHSNFAFFGHSLGALMAFEVARYLHKHELPQPNHLIVSGCQAPRHRKGKRAFHLLSDVELISELKAYNGTPPEILSDRELMKLVLPAVRADFQMAHEYQYHPADLLRMPLTVLAGTRDGDGLAEPMEQWFEESTIAGQLHWIDGDHFFIQAQQALTLACVQDALTQTQ